MTEGFGILKLWLRAVLDSEVDLREGGLFGEKV